MKLVLIGIQGAGKSTQGKLLSDKFDIPYLSSGHIFRQMALEDTPLGRLLKETMASGALIPDELTLEIVLEYLKRPEYEKGYILDGFPRTVPQAEVFNGTIDATIFLDVSDREALWRISGRVAEEMRADDTLVAIRRRIELFHELTAPVIGYYEKIGKLIKVDGEKDVNEVYGDILTGLAIKMGDPNIAK